ELRRRASRARGDAQLIRGGDRGAPLGGLGARRGPENTTLGVRRRCRLPGSAAVTLRQGRSVTAAEGGEESPSPPGRSADRDHQVVVAGLPEGAGGAVARRAEQFGVLRGGEQVAAVVVLGPAVGVRLGERAGRRAQRGQPLVGEGRLPPGPPLLAAGGAGPLG